MIKTRTLTSLCVCLLLGVNTSFAQNTKPSGADLRNGQQQNTPEKESRGRSKIKGRVISEGRPVADATIMIFPVNVAGNMETAINSVLRPTTCDADGNFELSSLAPGAYTLSASSPGYVLSEQPILRENL